MSREFTDEQLKTAAAGYLKAEAAVLAAGATLPLYSKRHNDRMQHILAAYRRKTSRRRTRRSIAAALAVLVLSFGILTAVSPTVYAAVESWTLNIYNKIVDYRFSHTSDDHAFLICAPAKLPEGFVRTENYRSGYYCRSTYKNAETGDYLRFEYRRPTEKQITDIERRGKEAELLLESGIIKKYYVQTSKSSKLFWYDPQHELVFYVESSLGRQELASAFENVSMRLPMYGPTWLPEGYKEMEEERIVDSSCIELVYADSEGEPAIGIGCYNRATFFGLSVDGLGDDVSETEKLMINGNVAFYHPGTENDPSVSLIMIDEHNHLVIWIDALLGKDDLIRLTESIKCTESEW